MTFSTSRLVFGKRKPLHFVDGQLYAEAEQKGKDLFRSVCTDIFSVEKLSVIQDNVTVVNKAL